MALQNFVDYIGPKISAAWLNIVDVLRQTVFDNAATKAAARIALTSDSPLETGNGGTGNRTGEPTFPITAAEQAATITPSYYQYDPGDARRYAVALGLTDTQLAQLAATGAYYESASKYTVAIGGKIRSKMYGDSTLTALELWSVDPANTGDVYIRFKEASGNTKGFVGYTGSTDDSMTITSMEDMRIKFRTGKTGDDTTFLNRAFMFGDTLQSYVGICSPEGVTTGGCYIKFTLDDYSVTKGYIGYASTADDDIDILNVVSGGNIDLQTTGGAVRVISGTKVFISGLGNYANDAAAAAGGVAVDQLYRNGSVLMVRVS